MVALAPAEHFAGTCGTWTDVRTALCGTRCVTSGVYILNCCFEVEAKTQASKVIIMPAPSGHGVRANKTAGD